MGNYIVMMFVLLMLMILCHGFEFKVGDLDAWGVPTAANPQVYDKWSKYHNLKIGDSILFLYPPSQDSVIQVTQESYKSCNLKDPILYMNMETHCSTLLGTGNSTSQVEKTDIAKRIRNFHITVGDANAPSYGYGPSALPEYAPSYPTVFGTIPVSPSSSSSSSPSLSLFFTFTASALLTLTTII